MESPLPPNPYKTLNVAEDASLAAIRSAHRKLVLTCHPDKFQDEEVKKQKSEQFHEVQQAYEILSDETRRQRYDERMKLAELRAEVMKEKGISRGAAEFSARMRPSPTFEVRGDRVYEERKPSRFHEEDVFSSTFQDYRPIPKKYDDRYSPPTSRRSSGRVPEEKRRTRDGDDDRHADKINARQSAKAAEKSAKHGQEKRKDKDKRKDREAKFTSKSAYVEDDDSDSDVTERYYTTTTTPKRRHEAIQRRDYDDPPRRNTQREDSNKSMGLESKIPHVRDYIQQCRRAAPVEAEVRRPAPAGRHFSAFEVRPPPPPPPPPALPLAPMDVRRSSARRESRRGSPVRLSTKDRRTTEIVDPPTVRRPSIPGISSDPRGLKAMNSSSKRDPLRAPPTPSATEPRYPYIRRSDTMPIGSSGSRRADTFPANPKLSEINDSGYSSAGTPELYQGASPPRRKSTTTSWRISEDEDDPRPTKVIYREPDEMRERERDRDRDRDISPRSRRPVDRPPPTVRPLSNTRGPPLRSNSYAFAPEPVPSSRPPPSFPRTESARVTPLQSRSSGRGKPQLYGEVLPTEEYKVIYSPRIRSNDISYSRRSPEELSRDTYPGSHFEPRHRPGLSRNESKAY